MAESLSSSGKIALDFVFLSFRDRAFFIFFIGGATEAGLIGLGGVD